MRLALSWDQWLGVAGSVASLVGLVLTVFAMRAAQSAEEAAREAANRIRHRLHGNRITELCDQLGRELQDVAKALIAGDLDRAGEVASGVRAAWSGVEVRIGALGHHATDQYAAVGQHLTSVIDAIRKAQEQQSGSEKKSTGAALMLEIDNANMLIERVRVTIEMWKDPQND